MPKRSDTSSVPARTPKPPESSREPGASIRTLSSPSGGSVQRSGRSRSALAAVAGDSGVPVRRNSKLKVKVKGVHGNNAKSSACNNSPAESPRASSRSSEPATDEDPGTVGENDLTSPPKSIATEQVNDEFIGDAQMDLMERQAVQMLRKIAKKSRKNQQRYNTIYENMAGHSKRMDELHESYGDMTRQMSELQAMCSSEMDADTLEELYLSIPSQKRLVPLEG